MAVYDVVFDGDVAGIARSTVVALLAKGFTEKTIDARLIQIEKLKKEMGKPKKDVTVESSDHEPCGTCGGTLFLRTGVCFVCQLCGSSAGCS